jgi:hypothetical protein
VSCWVLFKKKKLYLLFLFDNNLMILIFFLNSCYFLSSFSLLLSLVFVFLCLIHQRWLNNRIQVFFCLIIIVLSLNKTLKKGRKEWGGWWWMKKYKMRLLSSSFITHYKALIDWIISSPTTTNTNYLDHHIWQRWKNIESVTLLNPLILFQLSAQDFRTVFRCV